MSTLINPALLSFSKLLKLARIQPLRLAFYAESRLQLLKAVISLVPKARNFSKSFTPKSGAIFYNGVVLEELSVTLLSETISRELYESALKVKLSHDDDDLIDYSIVLHLQCSKDILKQYNIGKTSKTINRRLLTRFLADGVINDNFSKIVVELRRKYGYGRDDVVYRFELCDRSINFSVKLSETKQVHIQLYDSALLKLLRSTTDDIYVKPIESLALTRKSLCKYFAKSIRVQEGIICFFNTASSKSRNKYNKAFIEKTEKGYNSYYLTVLYDKILSIPDCDYLEALLLKILNTRLFTVNIDLQCSGMNNLQQEHTAKVTIHFNRFHERSDFFFLIDGLSEKQITIPLQLMSVRDIEIRLHDGEWQFHWAFLLDFSSCIGPFCVEVRPNRKWWDSYVNLSTLKENTLQEKLFDIYSSCLDEEFKRIKSKHPYKLSIKQHEHDVL